MKFHANWIQSPQAMGNVCPVFKKTWTCSKKIQKASFYLTSLGVYDARLNGKRISDYVLAPGWTVYEKRLQYQQFDITQILSKKNELCITVGKGWFSSPMPGWLESETKSERCKRPNGILGELHLLYKDGTRETILTDTSWLCGESPIRFSEIYDGETFDSRFITRDWRPAAILEWPKEILIPQEGEIIREMEYIQAQSVFNTPAGEIVVDFGQEVTGYVEFTVTASDGEKIQFSHGEILDQNGNFYNANYRSAKAEINYICHEGEQTWHPLLTFFGFRYIRLSAFPGKASPEQFRAIAVYSDIKKTGSLNCGIPQMNQLFSNVFWGQKGNFLDIPTDCPQRDERLGWTGDAQVFIKAASYNYDVEKFFRKWLHDLAAAQRKDGSIGQVIPDYLPDENPSAAWGDAATICPWQLYLTYGNKEILSDQFESMKKWVDFITNTTSTKYLWTGGKHFGDWLGLDAPSGSYKGSSREDFIATAFYAYSTELVIKAGKALSANTAKYETLYANIIKSFQTHYPDYYTQTEHVLALQFHLTEKPQETADHLAAMIHKNENQITTGFVGTPYILHVLSEYGYTELAYTLLLHREYPSWLYSVEKGATTIWEHWDGIMENGDFWSTEMNSFNHYAYGSVIDWIYEKAAGIHLMEEFPGFRKVKIRPMPDKRLGWLEASIQTRNGVIRSKWTYHEEHIRYEIFTDVPALIVIADKTINVLPGNYTFWS